MQITDTHIGDSDNDRRTEKVVKSINAIPMKIECVVHTGDVVSDLILSESVVNKTLDIMRPLKVPIHYVAGNHDLVGR